MAEKNIADQAGQSALATEGAQKNSPGSAAGPNKASKTTVAVGVTFDMSEARKFDLDVSAATEVTAEIISVPAPAKLTELLAARFKQDSSVNENV